MLIILGRVREISGMVVERGSWGVRVATWGLRVTVAWKQTAVRRKRRLLNSGARHYLKKYSQFYYSLISNLKNNDEEFCKVLEMM